MQTTNPSQLYIRWKCMTDPDSSNFNSISISFAKKIFLNLESVFLGMYPICGQCYYRFTNYTAIGINSLGVANLNHFHHQLNSRFF